MLLAWVWDGAVVACRPGLANPDLRSPPSTLASTTGCSQTLLEHVPNFSY